MSNVENPKLLQQFTQHIGSEGSGVNTPKNVEAEQSLYPYTALQNSLSEDRQCMFADINGTTEKQGVSNEELYETLTGNHIGIVNVTSLFLTEVVDLIHAGTIQLPHAVATKNGTKLYGTKMEAFSKNPTEITEDDFIFDQRYANQMTNNGYNKEALVQQARGEFFNLIANDFIGLAIDHQQEDRGDKWKTSGDEYELVCDVAVPTDSEITPDAIVEYARAYYDKFSVFLMHNGNSTDGNQRRYGLFVLPKGIGKHSAINYLFEEMNLSGAMFAGDSQNDASAMLGDYGRNAEYILRVPVGGSRPELLEEIARKATGRETPHWRELALEGATIWEYKETDTTKTGPESLNKAVLQAIKIPRAQKYSERRNQ
ncbi:MAG TPA: hypothetical protein VLG12_01195 [Candidatus Saccharimonadales bacterium]|nr:hypothetical protein [Candidatus Saccharimonadales bacterium]